jgi:hydroxyacylglutathione hydrolase
MSLVKAAATLSCDKESLLVLTCEHGPRAQLAKMMLKWSGFRNIELLDGHMTCWRRSGHPVEKGS